jgi:hypothetical protein
VERESARTARLCKHCESAASLRVNVVLAATGAVDTIQYAHMITCVYCTFSLGIRSSVLDFRQADCRLHPTSSAVIELADSSCASNVCLRQLGI